MEPFAFQTLPQRVVFGSGTVAAIGDEIERLGHGRAMVLSTPEQAATAETIAEDLGGLCVGVFSGAAMHTPVYVTEAALSHAMALNADCLVSIGGGSTTGLGKAIALRTNLDQIVIPTTYAGSEATPILGETADGEKTTRRSSKILPEVVVYDTDLTLGLPIRLSVTSGLNAIAHAIEALYTQDRNPIISLLAAEGIRALGRALPKVVTEPKNREARSDALYGAWACGTCLGAVGMALHHRICHVLGGSFDLPHSETHAVILPHATAFNETVVGPLLRPAARAIAVDELGPGLYDLSLNLGAPITLKQIGMLEAGLDRAADLIVDRPYWNPRPADRRSVRQLLDDAYFGRRPSLH
ncbi:MAG: maleylacetate reductase [Devosia sp.]